MTMTSTRLLILFTVSYLSSASGNTSRSLSNITNDDVIDSIVQFLPQSHHTTAQSISRQFQEAVNRNTSPDKWYQRYSVFNDQITERKHKDDMISWFSSTWNSMNANKKDRIKQLMINDTQNPDESVCDYIQWKYLYQQDFYFDQSAFIFELNNNTDDAEVIKCIEQVFVRLLIEATYSSNIKNTNLMLRKVGDLTESMISLGGNHCNLLKRLNYILQKYLLGEIIRWRVPYKPWKIFNDKSGKRSSSLAGFLNFWFESTGLQFYNCGDGTPTLWKDFDYAQNIGRVLMMNTQRISSYQCPNYVIGNWNLVDPPYLAEDFRHYVHIRLYEYRHFILNIFIPGTFLFSLGLALIKFMQMLG